MDLEAFGKQMQTKLTHPVRRRSSRQPTTMSSGAKKDPVASTQSTGMDLDKILSREANAFQRDVEVERILKAFKLK